MPKGEADVRKFYQIDGLRERMTSALVRDGLDPRHARPEDLTAVTGFPLGGPFATEIVLRGIEPGAQTRVLDLGCGLGDTARFIAWTFGARVVGLDLTPAFVETAHDLSVRVGLDGLTRFQEGLAQSLPFQDGTFELVLMQNVGMNIADKRALFQSVNRDMTPGGRFVVWDLMIRPDGPRLLDDVCYPMPWAPTAAASHLSSPESYRAAARAERLALTRQVDRHPEALDWLANAAALPKNLAKGPMIVMGASARHKMRNLRAAVESGHIGPCELVFEKFC